MCWRRHLHYLISNLILWMRSLFRWGTYRYKPHHARPHILPHPPSPEFSKRIVTKLGLQCRLRWS